MSHEWSLVIYIVIKISNLFSVELAVPHKRSSRKSERFCCEKEEMRFQSWKNSPPRDGEKETNEANESLCNGRPFILWNFALYSNFPGSDVIGCELSSDSRGERAQILALVDRNRKWQLYRKSSRNSVLVQFLGSNSQGDHAYCRLVHTMDVTVCSIWQQIADDRLFCCFYSGVVPPPGHGGPK